MAAVADKFKKFDQKIRTGEVAVLKKQLKRINIFAGFCLAAIGGVFGAIDSGFSLEIITTPSVYISKLILSIYCLYFGLMILMFELSNSPKVNKFFRENFGFYMTFGGRSAFFIGVGLFASGSGNAGFSGLVLVLDAFYHFYVVSRNPELRRSMNDADAARLAGQSTGDDSGMFTKMANMAVEDPNKLKSTAQMGVNMAQANPGMASAAMGMAASQPPAQAPAPAPAPSFAPAPAAGGAAFQVDNYDLGEDSGTAI